MALKKKGTRVFITLKLTKKFTLQAAKKIIKDDTCEGILYDGYEDGKLTEFIVNSDDKSITVSIPLDEVTSDVALYDLLSDFGVVDPEIYRPLRP